MPIAQFEQILIEDPQLTIKVFRLLGEKIIDLQERLEDRVSKEYVGTNYPSPGQAGKKPVPGSKTAIIFLKGEFTNRDLANMIGTTRETVSRTLTKLKREGKIRTDDNGYLIFQPDELLDDMM